MNEKKTKQRIHMWEIIPDTVKINFIGLYKFSTPISIIVVIASLFGLFSMMNYGVDFRGGVEVQIKFEEQVDLGEVRAALAATGLEGVSVQTLGALEDSEILINAQGDEADLNNIALDVERGLSAAFEGKGLDIRKVDIVGPRAGRELRISGFQAMFWALLAIMIYISLRFDFRFAPGAIVSLFHDVAIIVGVYAFTGTQFTLQTVAAILAVIGYSVNDTVVIFDRVREHQQLYPHLTLGEQINNAINETLSRTALTSGTTLFISLSLLLVGGAAIYDFFLAITIGVVVGTYSSVFVAAPVILLIEKIWPKKDEEPEEELKITGP